MLCHQSDVASLSNQLLIATRAVSDGSIFDASLIYLCEHHADGATGFVINKPSDMVLDDIYAQMSLDSELGSNAAYQVVNGGPLSPERGFVLHSDEKLWRTSYKLGSGIALTLSRDIIGDMAAGCGPASALLILGYASWQSGQLERELDDNYWLVAPANARLVFDTPLAERARQAAQLLGIDNLALLHTQKAHA